MQISKIISNTYRSSKFNVNWMRKRAEESKFQKECHTVTWERCADAYSHLAMEYQLDSILKRKFLGISDVLE